MKIQKGQVQYKDRDDYYVTYGSTDDGKQYYFIDRDVEQLKNGNRIASTELVEAIDEMVKANKVGVIDSEGNEVIPFQHRRIKPVNDDIVLAELATPVGQSVIDANTARNDAQAATTLVSTTTTIKDKLNAKMGSEGRFIFNDLFSEATVYDINGNNLVNGEYYSFIGTDNNKLYFSKNTADSEITEYSILPPEVQSDVTPANDTNAIDVSGVSVPQEVVEGALNGEAVQPSVETSDIDIPIAAAGEAQPTENVTEVAPIAPAVDEAVKEGSTVEIPTEVIAETVQNNVVSDGIDIPIVAEDEPEEAVASESTEEKIIDDGQQAEETGEEVVVNAETNEVAPEASEDVPIVPSPEDVMAATAVGTPVEEDNNEVEVTDEIEPEEETATEVDSVEETTEIQEEINEEPASDEEISEDEADNTETEVEGEDEITDEVSSDKDTEVEVESEEETEVVENEAEEVAEETTVVSPEEVEAVVGDNNEEEDLQLDIEDKQAEESSEDNTEAEVEEENQEEEIQGDNKEGNTEEASEINEEVNDDSDIELTDSEVKLDSIETDDSVETEDYMDYVDAVDAISDPDIADGTKILTGLMKQNKELKNTVAENEEELQRKENTIRNIAEKAKMQEQKIEVLTDGRKRDRAMIVRLESDKKELEDKVRYLERENASLNDEISILKPQLQGKEELVKLYAEAQALLGDETSVSYGEDEDSYYRKAA